MSGSLSKKIFFENFLNFKVQYFFNFRCLYVDSLLNFKFNQFLMKEEIKEINEEEIIVEETQNTSNLETPKSSDLYPYQCLLFVFTQFGYLAVVPSMLSTTFFEPNEVFNFFLNIFFSHLRVIY